MAGKHRLRRAGGVPAAHLIWRERFERQERERAAQLIETGRRSDRGLS